MIDAKNHKDQALQKCLLFLLACSRGAQPTAEQFKRMADLCGISLPMKYRLLRKEFEDFEWIRTRIM